MQQPTQRPPRGGRRSTRIECARHTALAPVLIVNGAVHCDGTALRPRNMQRAQPSQPSRATPCAATQSCGRRAPPLAAPWSQRPQGACSLHGGRCACCVSSCVSPDARPVPCARTLLACATAGSLPMVGGPGLRLAGRDLGLDLPPSWPGLARPAEGRSLAARGQVRYSAKSEASDHGSHGALAG